MTAKYALVGDLWPVDDLTANKPDVTALTNWLGLQSTPDDETLSKYQTAIDTAVQNIEGRTVLPYGTTDEDYPQRLATAELILASRLAKRATSPEGVAGMSDMGVVVRILGRDPDVEAEIMYFRRVGFA